MATTTQETGPKTKAIILGPGLASVRAVWDVSVRVDPP